MGEYIYFSCVHCIISLWGFIEEAFLPHKRSETRHLGNFASCLISRHSSFHTWIVMSLVNENLPPLGDRPAHMKKTLAMKARS